MSLPAIAWRNVAVLTGNKTERGCGVITPVSRESSLYSRFANNGVAEPRRTLARFFGRAPQMEDGVSILRDGETRYLVLESRNVYADGMAFTDAVLEQQA